MKDPYLILEINKNSTIEEIKKAYKKIALENHPDKNQNKEKNIQEENIKKFREATEAYNYLLNNKQFDNEEIKNWKDIWYDIVNNKNETKDFIKNMANIFMENDLINKKNKNIYKFTNIPIKHDINVNISYNEIFNNLKKKLRLILKEIDEPIFIEILCGDSYPKINKIYIDDDEIEHNIIINMKLINEENYNHEIINNKINLIYDIELNLLNYFEGYNVEIYYIDKKKIYITIPSFIKKKYEIKDKGIKGGSLIINIKYKEINKTKYNILEKNEKENLLKILNNII